MSLGRYTLASAVVCGDVLLLCSNHGNKKTALTMQVSVHMRVNMHLGSVAM